jgi:hypothetical protein
MGSLPVAMEYAKATSGIVLLIVGLLTAVLSPILNRTFDPDWLPEGEGQGRAGSSRQRWMRAADYAISVVRGKGPAPGSQSGEYDFRGRVGPVTRVLCRLYVGCIVVFGTGCVVWGAAWVLARWTGG